jgi:HNH endonuclease
VTAQRTRKILWTRAADRCAICRCKLTKDPVHSADREAVLGVECHIIARGKGGPRSGGIKSRELDDYRNLILLCPTHHKEVDDQPNEYTIEVLQKIKRKHEAWVDETLEWRAGLPEAFWQKIKEQADEMLLAEVGEVDEETASLLERLGLYVLLTAEFLAAPEMTLFIRGEDTKVSLGFKYEEGSVFFAFAEGAGFDEGFNAFDEAPAIEVHTDEVVAHQEEEESGELVVQSDDGFERFIDATATLKTIAERTSSADAVFYIREVPPSELPELAFRVRGGEVLFAGGPSGSFAAAHESFASHDPVDASHTIRARMLFDRYSPGEEKLEPKEVSNFLANSFAVSIISALEHLPIEGAAGDEQKAAFARHARNRFFEALLMLRAAGGDGLEDPRIRAWLEEHGDPRPSDGLSAVLPNACREAVRAYIEDMSLTDDDEAELEEDAIDLLYSAIDRVHRFNEDEEAQEALATLTMESLQWWGEPEARSEILEMARETT